MNNTSIIIAGSVVVLVSPHTQEELKQVAAYKPQALQLKDGDGEVLFSLVPGLEGNATPGALIYSETAPDGTGKACVTLPLPRGDDVKKAVAAFYGPIIAKANLVEAQIDAALVETNTMLAEVESQIIVAAPVEAAEEAEA